MDLITGKQFLENGSKGFRSGYSKVYGQIAMRLDDSFYLLTKENIILSEINKDTDIDVCDINTGDLGVLFNTRKDINAFVFACTETSVKVSEGRNFLRSSLDDFSEIVGPSIQVINSFTIDNCLAAIRSSNGCLVKGSGIVAVGSSVEDAVACAQIIEKCCLAENYSELLGGVKYIPDSDSTLCRKFYLDRYKSINDESFVNFVGFDETEFKLRNKLIDFGKQLCRDNLVFGTWGNISIRLNDKELLITPSGMDYFSIKPEDIVKVNYIDMSRNDGQRTPSRNLPLHAKMYRELTGCDAIVHTHSENLSCFAAAHAGFTIGVPELKDLIGDVLVTEYALEHEDDFNSNAIEVLKKTHAAILANHGAIFYGPSTELVLAIAGAVEARAAALLGRN